MRRHPRAGRRPYDADSPTPPSRARTAPREPAPAGSAASFCVSALDLGDASVKAAVCQVEAGRAYTLGQSVQPIAGVPPAQDARFAAAERALTQAEEMTPASAGQKTVADRAVITLSSAGISAGAQRIRYQRRAADAPLDEAEWLRILTTAQRDALPPLFNTASGALADPALLLPASSLSIWLDGRKVDDPLGLRGRAIEMSVFNAFVPAASLDALETLADRLQLDPPHIVLHAQALLNARRDALGSDGVGIDIGGRHTALMLWRDGGLQSVASVPHGGRDFTVSLGRACQADETRAERIKLDYVQGQFDAGQRAWIAESLQPAQARWFDAVVAALTELAGAAPLPPALWLWGGGAYLPESVAAARALTGRAGLSFAGAATLRLLEDGLGERIADRSGASLGLMGANIAAAPWGLPELADTPALRARLLQATLAACQAEQITYWTPVDG